MVAPRLIEGPRFGGWWQNFQRCWFTGDGRWHWLLRLDVCWLRRLGHVQLPIFWGRSQLTGGRMFVEVSGWNPERADIEDVEHATANGRVQ